MREKEKEKKRKKEKEERKKEKEKERRKRERKEEKRKKGGSLVQLRPEQKLPLVVRRAPAATAPALCAAAPRRRRPGA